MNYLFYFTSIYSCLRNYFMPYWVLVPCRKVIRYMANKQLPKYFLRTKVAPNNKQTKRDLIVSFTSFPARIDNVWQVVECMKRQTILPEKIILWLSNDQFPNEEIPQSIKDEIDELFEVRFVDGDIRSHKKYYYAAKEYPNSLLFLIDDDIYYSPSIIEKSLNALKKYPNHIICNYGCRMKYDKNGNIKPYNAWKHIFHDTLGRDLFFGSGGGTLFRPSDMYKDLTNIDLAIQLTPLADDIWLNTMALKAGLSKVILSHGPLLSIKNKKNGTLSSVNNGEGRNDEQINAVRKYYGDVFYQQ